MLVRYGSKLKIMRTASWDEVHLKEKKQGSFVNDKTLGRILEIKPIALNPDKYLYVQARAVSGGEKHGPNDNGDYFRWQELQERYMTFIGAAVNIDHKNNDPRWACGIIIDAILDPGEWVEIILAIDKVKAEKIEKGIIQRIETGIVTDVSMGCLVEFSICSTCLRQKANDDEEQLVVGQGLAHDPEEYCEHVDEESPLFCKGTTDEDGEPCYEDNRGVTFFEESIITTQGADPEAKMSQKLAHLKVNRQVRMASSSRIQIPSDTSSLVPFIKFNALDNVRLAHLKHISRGEERMSNTASKKEGEVKEAEKKPVVAAAPTDTQTDKGDYSDGDKNKQTFDQSKGKSPKEDEQRGSEVQTMQDRGDYTLAVLKAVRVLREAGKKDPSLVASLMPLIASDEMKEIEEKEKKADEVNMHKDKEQEETGAEEAAPEKKEVGEKPAAVDKGEDQYSEAAGTTAKKKDQKLSGKDSKFAELKIQAEALLKNISAAILGNQVETMQDKGEYSAGDVNKETKSVADSNASKSEAEKSAQDSAGNSTKQDRMKQVELAKKVAANEDQKVDYVASEMSKGKSFDDSMAEAEEKYKDDTKEAKTAEAEEELQKGTDKTKESPATASESEKENKMQDTEAAQEQAGSTTEKPEVEREIAAGKKVKAEEDPAEKKEDKKEEKKEGAVEDDKEKVEEAKIGEDDQKMIESIDKKAEGLEEEEKVMKEEAQNLASLGMSAEAKVLVKRISSIRARVATLNNLANSIEDNASRIAKISNVAQKKKALGSFSLLIKKASLIVAEVDKEEKDEKKDVESSMQTAVKAQKMAAENAQLRAQQQKQASTMKRIARNSAISSLIKVARNKGLLDERHEVATMARWAKLSDEAFAEVKASFEAAAAVKPQGREALKKSLREATAGLGRVADGELDGVEAPITATTKQSDLDDTLADMFMDTPYPTTGGYGRVKNSY